MLDEKDHSNDVSPEMEAVRFNRPDFNDGQGEEQSEGERATDKDQSMDEKGEDENEKSGKSDGSNNDPVLQEEQGNPEENKDKNNHESNGHEGDGKSSKSSSEIPQKIGPEKNKKSAFQFISILGLSLAGLFFVFILLMVLVVAKGGGSSPILEAFGIEPGSIRTFLRAIVNFSFGFLSVLFFVIGLIGVFKGLFVKKDDKQGKKRAIWMTIIGIIPLVIVLFVWLFLINIINRIQVGLEQVKAEILVTEPKELSDLQAPLQITFSAENVIKSLQSKNLSITGLRWDLNGDGDFETSSTDFLITYLYQNKGNYRVGLSVEIQGEDQSRTYFYPLSIQKAAFGVSATSGTPPLKIDFDARQIIPQGSQIKTLDWDFDGDGVYDLSGRDELQPTYTYNQIGTYDVHLRYVSQSNLVQNYYQTIEVKKGGDPLITAIIDSSPGLLGVAPYAIRFDADESTSLKGKIISYEWDFGDGSPLESGRSVSHTFQKPGDYRVTLKIKDDIDQSTTQSVQVSVSGVSDVPEAIITSGTVMTVNDEGQYELELPFTVSFDASASEDADNDIVDYEWDFGDGSSSKTGEKVDHTFEKAGLFDVKLLVRDADGQEDESSMTFRVVEPSLKAVINVDSQEGTAPLTVRFDGSNSSAFDSKIVSYEWDFGDGSPLSVTGARITHRYEKVGNYEARLKVTTAEGEFASSTKTIFVREIPLRACFSPSRNQGKAPLSITFDPSCSTGGIKNYNWNFGDGASTESRKPAHTFDEPGSYNVTLEVFDDKNNVSTFDEVILVEEK